jgi:serine/threonine protein kinase
MISPARCAKRGAARQIAANQTQPDCRGRTHRRMTEVTSSLGEGGMGKVWRAHHIALKRDDALKVLPEEGERLRTGVVLNREAAQMFQRFWPTTERVR